MASSVKPSPQNSSSCDTVVLNQGWFTPTPALGHLTVSGDILGGRVETRGAAINTLQCTGLPSTTKNYPVNKGSSAKGEKPCPKERQDDIMPTPDNFLTTKDPRPQMSVLKHIYFGLSVLDPSMSDNKMVAELSVPFICGNHRSVFHLDSWSLLTMTLCFV